MAFGIAKGFGLDKVVQGRLLDLSNSGTLPEPIISNLISFFQALLRKTRGGLIAGVGFLVLFWSVLSILQKIEESFNLIWEVAQGRTLLRKATDYLAIIVFTPVLIVISASVPAIMVTRLNLILGKITFLGALAPLVLVGLRLIPFFSIWTMLAIVYLIMPNTRVRVMSAVVSGIVTGTIYQAVQFLFITFQVGVANYGAIYGGFAALPLFIVWLQLSWSIILFGAEIAVAYENHRTFGFLPDLSRLSIRSRKLLLLRVMHLLVRRFDKAAPGVSVGEISRALMIPIRLARGLLRRLMDAGLVTETLRDSDRETVFQPGRTIEDLRLSAAIRAVESLGDDVPAVPETDPDAEKVKAAYEDIEAALEQAPENRLLKEV